MRVCYRSVTLSAMPTAVVRAYLTVKTRKNPQNPLGLAARIVVTLKAIQRARHGISRERA